MHRSALQITLCTISLAICTSTHALSSEEKEPATAPSTESVFETVVVDGLKDPHRLSVARLQKGVDAFKANHNFAPKARLRFMAIDAQPTTTPFVLKVEIDGQRTAIAVDTAGLFDLPHLTGNDATNADLVSNRRKGNLRIRPYVATPGFEGNRRRLGDLRLECAAYWAIRKDDFSLFQKAVVGVVGGACTSSNVTSSYPVPRKLTSAQLAHGDRIVDVTIKEVGMGFWPPMYDTSWPDDAVVRLTFAEPGQK